MKRVINLYKPKGLTPLKAINLFRQKHPQYKEHKITYAGRLDPMAHGVLLLLVEPYTHQKERYLELDKDYDFSVLFGVGTDSYDLLGIPALGKILTNPEPKLEKALQEMKGTLTQKYPPYSSKPVAGKPLFQWAREGRLSEITIPTRKVHIHDVSLLSLSHLSSSQLLAKIEADIAKVQGDFRQKEIINEWRSLLSPLKEHSFLIARLTASVSSGTYIRSLANGLGKKLGTRALASDITRTRVGDFLLSDSLKLD